MDRFINILQFLTRINIKKDTKFDPELGKGIVFFPLVGLIIGIIMYLIYYVVRLVPAFDENMWITSVFVLLGEVVITGGLHLDGLADTFDGMFSYRSKSGILEIMKDSRMGTNASISLMFLILVKVILLASFFDRNIVWPLVLMPVMGRLLGVMLTYKTVSARENGMGNIFIGKCDSSSLVLALGFVAILQVLFMRFVEIGIFGFGKLISTVIVLMSIGLIYLLAIGIKRFAYKKIDGLTGDILGCGIELGELVFILYIFVLVG